MEKGYDLIDELFEDPVKFSKQGKTYALLQQYIKGFDLETLRPLLKNRNPYILSAGTFIVSELGKKASAFIDDLLPLLSSDNVAIKYEVLESIMLGSLETNTDKFIFVIYSLEDKMTNIRVRAMELTSRANGSQVKSSLKILQNKTDSKSKIHARCLYKLLNSEDCTYEEIFELQLDRNHLSRRYGAILAKLKFNDFPDLIKRSSENNDQDIQNFAVNFLNEKKFTD